MIPRVFHWVWLGGNPLPARHAAWRDGWLEAHPGWEHHLWTESNLPPLENRTEFESATSLAQASDVVRYELIRRFGGVYLDTDVECLRSIDDLVELDAFIAWEQPGRIGTAVFGAAPGHAWPEALVRGLPEAFRTGLTVIEQTGPGYVTAQTQSRSDVTLLPASAFFTGHADAYGIHHVEMSWREQFEVELASKWRAVVEQEVDPLVPADGSWIRVDDGAGVDAYSRRRSFSYPDERLGLPASEEDAVAQVAGLREQGAAVIAFVGTSRWWLDDYRGLRDYLDETARLVTDNGRAVVYDLRSAV